MRASRTIAGLVSGAFTVAVIALAYAQDRKERQLIADGLCEVQHEAWYQPPPTQICTLHDSNGVCQMWTPIPRDPYLRSWWVCQGGETFWRRKVMP